ncbi:unnamed protein product [marine sediment metagenome]|uniref:Uncharacterized protein n=1 Tax=marine sediment metagenome TaxID=412755 RepID=X1T7T4_9ZZZZ
MLWAQLGSKALDTMEDRIEAMCTSKEKATNSIIKECSFQCLSNCPLPPSQDCLYDDPLIGMFDRVEYPKFFQWRFEQIFGNSDEFLEVTPDMMDGYFREPEDRTQTRCPRCLSAQVDIGYPYIKCKNCGYNEPLIDFPENVGFNI